MASALRKVVVNTANAPAALGPYSQAIRVGSHLYISGQLGLVPASGEFKTGEPPVRAQTEQAMRNMGEILKTAGATFDHVVKTTILLVDMAHFPVVNDVYKGFFNEAQGYPARACYQVAALPKGGLVEIEAIAVLPE